LFDRYDTDGNGRFLYKSFAEMLVGKKPDVAGNSILRSMMERIRVKVLEKGGVYGIRTLVKMFRSMNAPELWFERDLHETLKQFGILLDDKELAYVMSEFDLTNAQKVNPLDILAGHLNHINRLKQYRCILSTHH